MSNTKQHFVPKFYLRKWSDSKEKIWKYKTDGRKNSAQMRPFASSTRTGDDGSLRIAKSFSSGILSA
ncbi:MAG TPA: DUF4238 domain-containing protein [Verrucomicrobiae bacterium]